jgi:enoyl-CoA hydratase
VIALIDGIVMGGGVGVSINAAHHVAGERFVFAMPEVGIGFFPDVGGTYFLPRLARRAGVFFALTGLRAHAGDALAFGLVQTFVPSARFGDLATALEGEAPVEATLARFAANPQPSKLMKEADGVEACFSLPTRDAILDALAGAQRRGFAFAGPARAAMLEKSPTSQAIALRQMALGPSLDIHEALRVEYGIVSRVCRGHDFYEGVRALIVDKDNRPQWSAPPSEAELDGYFAALGADELTFPVRDA